MPPGVTLKDIARESNLFRSRVVTAYAVIVALFVMLLLRLVQLQVVEYKYFQTLSHNNRVKIVPIAPTRGLIFDRNGVVLAQNTPSFSLEIVPEDVGDIDKAIAELATIVAISDADKSRFRKLYSSTRRFESILLRTRLTEEEVARFSVNRHRFPGVDVHARLSRDYPLGSLGVHVVGYVGRINERELEQVDVANYRGSSYIGKTGAEQAYEEALHGRVGYQHLETNARGRTLRVLKREPPVPGRNLYLSIDASLQAAAESVFHGETGALVAIEPSTGDVLALVSMPGFDPNLFVDGIDAKTYRALVSSPDRPLFNRALAGQYPPGSTVKPFLGLAGLERDVDHTRKRVWCPGWYSLKGHSHKYRDWRKHGHGRVDLDTAIVQSCDVYFYELALALGIDRMHEFMTEFGFGRRTGIDLAGEAPGLMPSSEWKRQARNQPWYPGETLITGIGQGFVLSTPLQLASATATLGMRGLHLKPSVGMVLQDPSGNDPASLSVAAADSIAQSNPENWESVVDAMIGVVHGPRGTARQIGVGAAYRIAGKTGTAQLFSIGQDKEYEGDQVAKELRDHALFISFAPADRPRIAVAVVVENGGSGSRAAAPLARKVMDHYLRRLYEGSGEDGFLLTSARAGGDTLPGPASQDQTPVH